MEHAQRAAAKTVRRVLTGTPLPVALAETAASQSDRALIHELSYGTLRFLGQVRAIVRELADRRLSDISVEALLWVSLYQLIHTNAPQHTVVDAAVRGTARLKRSSARGLTNAILRTFLRRKDAVLDAITGDAEARYSYPRWWIDRIEAEYPNQSANILDDGNERPPLCLRVNRRAIARGDYAATLEMQGISARSVGEDGITIIEPRAINTLPGFVEGWFSVQDAGAQLAAPLLAPQDGMRVLDACAAPGGKTSHLAELANIDLIALDVDAARLARVTENLDRLQLRAQVIAADAAETSAWWDGVPFDRIMADVPCSASGVVRRHPDVKWLRREADIAGFTTQQSRLLQALWLCLKRGGTLLYTTCSIFHAENEGVVSAFAQSAGDVLRIGPQLPPVAAAIDGQLLPARGDAAHNHDGFFYALLQKR